MPARVLASDAARIGDVIDLSEEEGRHVERVLRVKAGEHLRVFNGAGLEFDAVVERCDRHGVRVRLVDAAPVVPEARTAIALACAVLKGDKMDDVVRDAVMLGVASIQPLFTARSDVSAASVERGRRVERWEKIVVASAKQCGRATLPSIRPPIGFSQLLDAVVRKDLPSPAFMLTEPSAGGGAGTLADVAAGAPRQATVVVGPEGGWTETELALGAERCQLVTLGERTLRADAVPVVGLTALLTRWGEL